MPRLLTSYGFVKKYGSSILLQKQYSIYRIATNDSIRCMSYKHESKSVENHVNEVEKSDDLDKLFSLIEVECRGHEVAVLRSYLTYVSVAAKHLEINLDKVEWPPKHITRWTILKSVHIHKRHKVQYEARTHFLIMKFTKLTGSTADTFLEYIQRNLPEGVSMKVSKHELQRLPLHVKTSSEVII